MFSEVVNAIVLTYFASEYLIADHHHQSFTQQQLRYDHDPSGDSDQRRRRRLLYYVTVFVTVGMVNVLDRVSGAQQVANNLLEGLLHIPRLLFVAVTYMITLYWDVKRNAPLLHPRIFLSKVGWAFVAVLPAYPFMAVLISFVFLFVVNLWEALHLPMDLLNAPIYYGTLYGPFAWVYIYVKRQVLEEATSLPL